MIVWKNASITSLGMSVAAVYKIGFSPTVLSSSSGSMCPAGGMILIVYDEMASHMMIYMSD